VAKTRQQREPGGPSAGFYAPFTRIPTRYRNDKSRRPTPGAMPRCRLARKYKPSWNHRGIQAVERTERTSALQGDRLPTLSQKL
jgi:hypothetical protein